MKKSLIALTLLSATSVQASGLEYNLGLGVSMDNNHIIGSSDETYVLRAGVIAQENHRFLGTYTNSSDSKLSKFLTSYGYLYGLDSAKRLNFITGVTLGYKYQDVDSLDNKGHYMYGGQAGLNYRFTQNISTELGYRLLSASNYERDSLPFPPNDAGLNRS